MIAYLLKSSLSLVLLLAIYYLALQREKMHGFKRFYLLFAICFSFIIPFIEIETASETFVIPEITYLSEEPVFTQPIILPEQRFNLLPALWIVYSAGVLLMLFRFIKNLWHLRSVVKNNTVTPLENVNLVLLNHPVIPHSFFNYIFFSKEDYEQGKIEQELFRHELTHVMQKHSFDIVFIECLRIVFWFNPLIYLYRKAIKLNHEFLADEAVVHISNDVTSYQQILLSKLFMNKASGLASHVNYSLTKKRLIMMSKQTPFIRALALKAAMVPLFTVVMAIFCSKTLAQVQPPPPPPPAAKNEKQDDQGNPPKLIPNAPWTKIKNQDSLRAIKERYYGNKPEIVFGWIGKDGARVQKHWSEMTEQEKQAMHPPPPPPKRMRVSQQQLDDWSSDPQTYGIWINGYRKKNEELKKYRPEDFGHYSVSRLHRNAVSYKEHKVQVNVQTVESWKKWYDQSVKDLGIDPKQ